MSDYEFPSGKYKRMDVENMIKFETAFEGKTLQLSDANNWKATFIELPVYSDDKKIKYTIEENTQVEGYEKPVITVASLEVISTLYDIIAPGEIASSPTKDKTCSESAFTLIEGNRHIINNTNKNPHFFIHYITLSLLLKKYWQVVQLNI